MRDIDKYTENYIIANFEDYQIKYRRKLILDVMSKYNPKTILEIGCGMKPLFQYIDDIKYEKYVVVDPSNKFFDNAVRLSRNDDRIECIHDFFTARSVPHIKYDMIICASLLHEIENPGNMLKEIRKISQEETVIHINVPNVNSVHRLLAKSMGLITDVHEKSERNILYQQNTNFDLESLKSLICENGFMVVESGSYFIKPFTHTQMYEMIKADIINESVLDGLYKLAEIFPENGSEIYVNAMLK